jgi:hypothetical protein
MEESQSTVIQPKIESNSKINESEYKSEIDNLENYELNNAIESIKNFNKEHDKEYKRKEETGHGLICTNIKDIDWLSNIFLNKDIKNMLIQNNHIREILVDQALYYFRIFSKIYSIWSYEREKDKAIKEKEKEREKQKQKYHTSLPPIDMKALLKGIVIPKIKVGIIGCGSIGKKLLKSLIKIKDKKKKIIDFQIQVSTRQPDKLMNELLDLLDEDISIFLNNEKVFEECDLIFLCIQPVQLDLLSKEVFNTFSDKVEKLIRKEYKCYPFLVSFLSATTVNRLEMFFPRKVHIERTRLLHNFLRSKKKALFSGGNVIEEDGEYIDESCDHFLAKEKSIEIIENLIIGLTKQFYSQTIIQQKKNSEYKNKKIIEKPIYESPLFLFEIIFGKDLANKYYEIFDCEKGKFIIKGLDEKKEHANNLYSLNNNTNEDNLIEKKEESNPEEIKIKQEFFKNIVNDFKKMFIFYLEELIKN